MLFLARVWEGDAMPDGKEAADAEFVDVDALPSPLHPPTERALGLLRSYLDSGAFQVG